MIFTTIANARKQTGLSYLGTRNVSSKLLKNEKVSKVITYCMYLAPANTSGYNVCKGATKECKLGCLATSGHVAIEVASGKNMIQKCRINKTRLFHEHNEFFMAWLFAELLACKNYAEKRNMPFSFRLNGTSDIDWTKQYHKGNNMFAYFQDCIAYDYTKVYDRIDCRPLNYCLVFSHTGTEKNVEQCLELLARGYNVAVVFDTKKGKALPETWNGFPVIDGDLTDYRVTDGWGVVVGLRWKRIANKQVEKEIKESHFVVKTL